MLVFPPVSKAGPSHPQVLHQPQVLDLMPYEQVVKLAFGNTEGRGTVKDPTAPFQPRQTTGHKPTVCGLGLATDICCQVLTVLLSYFNGGIYRKIWISGFSYKKTWYLAILS